MNNIGVSIKLYVIEDRVVTDVYYHPGMCLYDASKVLKTLEELCNPSYIYKSGLTRERLFRFMLGYLDDFKDTEIIVDYNIFCLLNSFTHTYYTDIEAKDFLLTTDYEFKWYKN